MLVRRIIKLSCNNYFVSFLNENLPNMLNIESTIQVYASTKEYQKLIYMSILNMVVTNDMVRIMYYVREQSGISLIYFSLYCSNFRLKQCAAVMLV